MARCAHPLLGASVSSRSKFGSQQHPAMYADVCFNSMTSSRSTGQTAALGVCVNGHRHRAKSSDADGASSEDVPGKEKGKKKTKKRRRLLDNAGGDGDGGGGRGGGRGGSGSVATVTSGKNTMAVHTITNIAAGDEIMNHYGELGDVELLHRYGFCEGNKNPFDAVVSLCLMCSLL